MAEQQKSNQAKPWLMPVVFEDSMLANYGHSNLQNQSNDMLRLIKFGLISDGYDASNAKLNISDTFKVGDNDNHRGFQMMLSGVDAPKSVIGKSFHAAFQTMMYEFNDTLKQDLSFDSLMARQRLLDSQTRLLMAQSNLLMANHDLLMSQLRLQDTLQAKPDKMREATDYEVQLMSASKEAPVVTVDDVARSYGINAEMNTESSYKQAESSHMTTAQSYDLAHDSADKSSHESLLDKDATSDSKSQAMSYAAQALDKAEQYDISGVAGLVNDSVKSIDKIGKDLKEGDVKSAIKNTAGVAAGIAVTAATGNTQAGNMTSKMVDGVAHGDVDKAFQGAMALKAAQSTSVAGTMPSSTKSLGQAKMLSHNGGENEPPSVAVADSSEPPKSKMVSDKIVPPETSDKITFKEGVLAFGKGKHELGNGQYQPDNSLAMLRSNCNAFTKNILDSLRHKGLIDADKSVDLKIGFGDAYTSLSDEKHFISHVAFNDIGVPSDVMAGVLQFAATKTIGDLYEQATADVKKYGLKYTGPDLSDALAFKCGDVHDIGESTYKAVMRGHEKSLGESVATTMKVMQGEPYPCPDKKVALHKNGAVGITLSNDGNAPKTVDDYRTQICNRLDVLKDAIDEELGLSYEESRKCTLDISRTFKDGEKSEFMIAFSGYDAHADELQTALRNGMESMFGGQLYNGDYSFFKMSGNDKRISPETLNDTTKFESPDVYRNATGLTTADGRSFLKYGDRTFTPATLNETLLPSESQSLENSGMQL